MSLRHWLCCVTAAVIVPLGACGEGAARSSGATPNADRPAVFEDYREIPGVTIEEISDIERVKLTKDSFVYGMTPGTESFFDVDDGSAGGFSALFCEWLGRLFGVDFELRLVEWPDLAAGLADGSIDFSGGITMTEGRRAVYFMTEPIAYRPITAMRLTGNPDLLTLSGERAPIYSVVEGTTTADGVDPYLSENELIRVKNLEEAFALMQSGAVDFHISESAGNTVFDAFGDVVSEPFIPYMSTPVSFATQSAELSSFVNVVQKAIDGGAYTYFMGLYRDGDAQYWRRRFLSSLTKEERVSVVRYSGSLGAVRVGMEYDNYPISFYNTHEREWQGIAVDVINEVARLTGMNFTFVNGGNDGFPVVLRRLVDHETDMVAELMQTPEREGKYLWTDEPYAVDRYALLSRADLVDLSASEVYAVRVGLLEDSAYEEIFLKSFPQHQKTRGYSTIMDAYSALSRGEIDMVAATRSQLLAMTNYMEMPGFKINFMMNSYAGSSFGFNAEETTLRSIISKAQNLVDTGAISDKWYRKTFDYTEKLANAKIPWLVGAILLLFVVVSLISVTMVRMRVERDRLLEKINAADNQAASGLRDRS